MLLLNLFLSLLIGFNSSELNNNQKIYSSRAYNKADGKYIYSEQHKEIYSGNRIIESVTKYLNTANKPLSERVMKFSDDLSKPSFVLNDFRTGYMEGAEILKNNKVKVYTRETYNDPLQEKIVTVAEPFVIDGGLTFFFRKNWDRLMAGETIEFNFIAPAKLDYYRFRVSKSSITTIANRKGLKLKLEINNFILRQFVSPVYITYALDNKDILYYEGISNINDDNGKSYSVRIDFSMNGEKR